MSSILILGSCFIACLALRAVAQDAPIIFSNQGLLKDWPSESYASTAYSNSGCLSQQYAPADLAAGIDSVVGIAVRVNLPLVGGYHTHWSITKIAVPLRRTSISTVTDLSNYQIVFYQDSGSLAPASPMTPADIFAFKANASANNSLWALPGEKIATVQFDDPAQAVTVSASWFNLSIIPPLANCLQLKQGTSVWMSLVPKGPMTLDNFYDGITWVGAQSFLTPPEYPTFAWASGAARYIYSVVDGGSVGNTCGAGAGVSFVQQSNWTALSVDHVPQKMVENVAYGVVLYGWGNDEGCIPPSPTPSATGTPSPSPSQV